VVLMGSCAEILKMPMTAAMSQARYASNHRT
jgi:hypothetical protein